MKEGKPGRKDTGKNNNRRELKLSDIVFNKIYKPFYKIFQCMVKLIREKTWRYF